MYARGGVMNVETEKTTDSSLATSKTSQNRLLGVLRTIALDLPLAMIFAGLLLASFANHLYTEYYPRLLDQYERDDRHLEDQQTYYHRYCTAADLTTHEPTDLLVDTNEPVDKAVDQLMTHGGVVFPQLIKPETAAQLREYVDQRNRAISDKEQFPMYPPQNRLSYGFDATESPTVVKALQEVTNNPFFYDFMSSVLGDEDPAACELTTIASFYGAEDQGWHSDTKDFGNALKFSRSYAHTYSLFLALQNTTKAMGATEICPGTHMCANPLFATCDESRMSLADAGGTGQMNAGDGALLSQIVWHQGAAHSDPNAPERILFIITFLARPRHDRDPRQFAKGTYFHMKWNMWGHTWKDLQNPMEYMKPPFSTLRALSLWKPSTRNWGYDMVTSLTMQLSNQMLHGDDLTERLTPRLDAIGFPRWLRGPLKEEELDQRDAWKAYWDGTIGKTLAFFQGINFFALLLYILFVGALSFASWKQGRGLGLLGGSVMRTSLTHGSLYILYWWGTHSLANTTWGKRVMAGKEMFEPFPPVRILKDEELSFVPKGPTTYPGSDDVLFGTRFDAKWLGSYEKYLDYHRGNRMYRQKIKSKAPYYHAYRGLPKIFQERLVADTIQAVADIGGRFLDQDFRIGTWHVLSDEETLEKVHRDMITEAIPIEAALVRILDREIADYRFLKVREAAMGAKSWLYLQSFKSRLLATARHMDDVSISIATPKSMLHVLMPKKTTFKGTRPKREKRVPAHLRFTAPPTPTPDMFRLGARVWVALTDPETQQPRFYRGDIIEIDEAATPTEYTVSMESNERVPRLVREHLSLYTPLTEGDRVGGCYVEPFQECFPGKVARVLPDLSIAIAFEDGDFDDRRPRNTYFVERKNPHHGYPEPMYYWTEENPR